MLSGLQIELCFANINLLSPKLLYRYKLKEFLTLSLSISSLLCQPHTKGAFCWNQVFRVKIFPVKLEALDAFKREPAY